MLLEGITKGVGPVINKKNVLGKHPLELGVKDAIHTAIVSVRAGASIKPGQRVGMNEYHEAVPNSKGPGIADPFLRETIMSGQHFQLMLDQDQVPNVQHQWDHEVDFSPPTREPVKNKYLASYAEEAGVTYEQLMDACAKVVKTSKAVPYPGTKTQDEIEDLELYDLWSEWADETGYEFENHGSACCPEYDYPKQLFRF